MHRTRHVLVLAALVAVTAACGGKAPADVGALVPDGAAVAVFVPPMSELRTPLLQFLDGMEGASGGVEWLHRRYGLDLRTEDGLARAGLDDRAGVAIFVWKDALWLAAGVSDRERLETHLGTQLQLFGYAAPEAAAEGSHVRVAIPRAGVDDVPPLVYGITEHRALVAIGREGNAATELAERLGRTLAEGAGLRLDAEPRLATLAGEPSPNAIRLFTDLEQTLLSDAALDPVLGGFGVSGNLVKGYLRGFGYLGGRIEVTPSRLGISLQTERIEGSAAIPVDWLRIDGSADFGVLLPSSTAVLTRLRLDARKVEMLPGSIRGYVLRSNPVRGWHPLLERRYLLGKILPHLAGDVAFAVLGVSESASLSSLQRVAVQPARTPLELDIAVLARVRDPAAFRAEVETFVEESRQQGVEFQPLAVRNTQFPAYYLTGGTVPDIGVALAGDVALLTTGRGELERIVRAASGDAPSLRARTRTDLDAAAVGSDPFVLAGHISFDRVARQLQCKGVPPYFLKVITSPDAVAWTLHVDERAARLDLEVTQ